jgi:hypothetical protein
VPTANTVCVCVINICYKYIIGAYPYGDAPQYWSEMASVDGLKPFPNGVLWNWATVFILGFGNLSAIDFQVSHAVCHACKQYACFIAVSVSLAHVQQ